MEPTPRAVTATRGHRGLFQAMPERRSLPERTKARTQDSRQHNRSLVLATLYQDGPMTRPELSRATGLTAPTISALVADLEQDGLVADIGPREGTRLGKPAGLVRLEDGAATIVALDLSHSDRFTGAVLDLRGTVLDRAEVEIGDAVGPEADALVHRLAAELVGKAPRRVLGIGVGTPGLVDDQGVVRQAAHLEWTDLPMAADLAGRFGVPARVGNDINLAALAVRHFREVRALNLMVVSIEHGVGAGLVVGGELVEGEQYAAGEIGHVTVEEDGEPCVCGRRGCLDPLIDAGNLRRRLAAVATATATATAAEAASSVRAANDAAGNDAAAATAAAGNDADADLDRHRDEVLAAAGRALGVVLAPIVSVLNLNDVVLAGPAELVDGPFLDAVRRTVAARTLAPISASVAIRSTAGDPDLVLLGAAGLVLASELGVL
ncbi:ROK family transcriptional regulator [Catenulispora subtropica]|uniref:ROK family transcriptional regulator n=1 Tax=Catenulispora subtropica TaxID=450798 RepID=A0ABN2SCZ7_9ACTN